MRNQTVLGVNCTYLGESLAALVLFRDERSPFTEEDIAMLKAISGTFATSLASMVRGADESGEEEDFGSMLDEEYRPRQTQASSEKNDADWWKRGEAPPF